MTDLTNETEKQSLGGSALNDRLGKWISVKDRLPDNGKDVLAIVIDKENGKGWHWNIVGYGHYEFYTEDETNPDADEEGLVSKKGWHYERDSEGEFERLIFELDDKVTHWMPLPQPPTFELGFTKSTLNFGE